MSKCDYCGRKERRTLAVRKCASGYFMCEDCFVKIRDELGDFE